MADIIDQANDTVEQHIMAQRTIRRHSSLIPAGACHYCDELLPKVGQLFCNRECAEDHEKDLRLRGRQGG